MNCKDIAEWRPLYLSGELGAASVAAFTAHIQNCAECAAALERETHTDAVLRAAILAEEIDTAEVDRRVRARLTSGRHSFSTRWMAVAAGVAALLLAGTLGYRKLAESQMPDVCAAAARDHRTEVIARQPRKWLSDPKAIAELAERNGVSGSAVAALAPAGYRLERGKLCRLNGRVFLHLVYTGEGREFSTFLRREKESGKPLSESDAGAEHVAYFQTGQLTAMVVSEQSREAALTLARFAAGVL